MRIKKKYRENTSIDPYFASLYSNKNCQNIPSAEEQKVLFVQARNGNAQARQRLIEGNMRLVPTIAKWYSFRTGIPFLDIVQEGNCAIIEVVDYADYNPSLSRLSTYIRRCIRNAILNFIRHEFGGLPKGAMFSIEADEAKGSLIDQVSIENSLSPEDHVIKSSNHKFQQTSITNALNKLPERNRDVVERRFGLNGHNGETKSLAAIGRTRKKQVSRERVRQIKVKCFKQLRELLDTAEIRASL